MKLQVTKALKQSYWQESIKPDTTICNLDMGVHADVVIIGGGYVGLWTALTIKEQEPDCRVVVLEQDICGGGASGRNGGFVMSWWPKIGTLKAILGHEKALFLGQQAEQAISDLGEFCLANNIDAHFTHKGWLWTATTPLHVDSWNTTLQACEDLGVRPFEKLTMQELRARTGSSLHLSGIFEASNATVQPYALAKGMKRVALAKGVEVYERAGVTEIEESHPIQIHTVKGSLLANKVVLATNAWSASIPELAKLMTPVNSSIVATQPLGEEYERIGWTGGESITDSQLMVDYYRTTKDGRIVFGKGTGALAYRGQINQVFSNDAQSIEMTKTDLFRTYPSLSKDSITHYWSGPIDRTYDSLPVFGSLAKDPNILFGIGWSGNGVGPSRLGGKILASLVLNRKDEWSECGLVGRKCKTFPPEPFRYMGGNAVRNAVIRKERDELQGNKPKKIDCLLAGLAPSGLEDKT